MEAEFLFKVKPYASVLEPKRLSDAICWGCLSQRDAVHRCLQCFQVKYCCKACQKTDWLQHKLECAVLKQMSDANEPALKEMRTNFFYRLFLRALSRRLKDEGMFPKEDIVFADENDRALLSNPIDGCVSLSEKFIESLERIRLNYFPERAKAVYESRQKLMMLVSSMTRFGSGVQCLAECQVFGAQSPAGYVDVVGYGFFLPIGRFIYGCSASDPDLDSFWDGQFRVVKLAPKHRGKTLRELLMVEREQRHLRIGMAELERCPVEDPALAGCLSSLLGEDVCCQCEQCTDVRALAVASNGIARRCQRCSAVLVVVPNRTDRKLKCLGCAHVNLIPQSELKDIVKLMTAM